MGAKKLPKNFISFWAVFPKPEDAIEFLKMLPLEEIILPENEVIIREDGSVLCKLCTRVDRDKNRALEHRIKHLRYLAKMCIVCIFLGRPCSKRVWLSEDAYQKHMNNCHGLQIKTLGKWKQGSEIEQELYKLLKMWLPLGHWENDPEFDAAVFLK